MDPHSRLSQFNHRGPKSGPPPASRFASETTQKINLDAFASMSLPVPSSTKKKTHKASSSGSALLVRRPIATNSRIKRDENYRKDMYLAFVNNALQQKLDGQSEPFDELVKQFNPKHSSSRDTSTSLRTWILALTHVVSRLERTHSSLVEAIVSMPWTTLDSATVRSYTVFIGMLLSARPEYLSLVLGKIALGFTYYYGLQALSQAFPESSADPVTRRMIYDRLHYLLQHLLSLIPTLPSTLQPLLVRHFPHKRQNQIAQTTYIRNLLRVSSYCPELSEKILATIVDRAIQIDVEIQVELEEIEEEHLEEQPLFEIDPFDVVLGEEEPDFSDIDDTDDDDENDDAFSDLSSDAGDGLGDDVIPEIPTNVKHIQDMVKKLDVILTLLFEHFQRTHSATPSIPTVGPGNDTPSRITPQNERTSLPPLPPLPSDSPLASPVIISSPSPARSGSTPLYAPATPLPLVNSSTSVSRQARMNLMRIQFNALLSIFDRTILRTFKSRYTQFLIFWYASLDPEFTDIFQGMLVERAVLGTSAPGHPQPPYEQLTDEGNHNATPDPGGSMITRAAAASYIGSFVSRAVFVDAEGTRGVVAVLCEFLRAHLDEVEEAIRTLSSPVTVGGLQHTVFYAVTQAVFLIFCFRWRDLIELGEGVDDEGEGGGGSPSVAGSVGGKNRNWMSELGVLQRVVNSVLNPLKVCSSNVVMQFARVAQATDFIYCYTILDRNKRSEHNSSSSSDPSASSASLHPPTSLPGIISLDGSDSTSAAAELNTFFPFDPYRLPKSSVFIRDVYREWASVAIDDESDEENSENDEEGEEEEADFGHGSVSGLLSPSLEGKERYLRIPQTKPHRQSSKRRGDGGTRDEDEATGGLGESLEQMSISPRYETIPRTSVMSVRMG